MLNNGTGTLYVISTPIGNLDDITLHMNSNCYKKKRYKIKNSVEPSVKKYNINTTIDFGNNKTKLKLNTTGIETPQFKITKLEFLK